MCYKQVLVLVKEKTKGQVARSVVTLRLLVKNVRLVKCLCFGCASSRELSKSSAICSDSWLGCIVPFHIYVHVHVYTQIKAGARWDPPSSRLYDISLYADSI